MNKKSRIIKDVVLQVKIEGIINKAYNYLRENGVINPNKHPAHYKLFRNVLVVEIDQLIAETKEECAKDYNELIMAVVCKFPDETRHQTALRYITERESQEVAPAKAIRDTIEE